MIGPLIVTEEVCYTGFLRCLVNPTSQECYSFIKAKAISIYLADPQVISSILDVSHFDKKILITFSGSFTSSYKKHTSHWEPQRRWNLLGGGLTLPTISDAQKCELNAPISREEALLALKSLQSGKAPGGMA